MRADPRSATAARGSCIFRPTRTTAISSARAISTGPASPVRCAMSATPAITLEPFRRDDDRPGIPHAQWKAPQKSEDAELAASIRLLDAALAFSGRAR